jgi:hypothetical protein
MAEGLMMLEISGKSRSCSSVLAKKKSLFFLIAPPMLPPN